MSRPLRITVVGGSRCDDATATLAEQIGREVARRGGVLVCGGLGGVMEAASKGASAAGGLVVGILPGVDAREANPHVAVPIPTGMGEARNVVNVRAGDAVIALRGSHGTLSEIAFALGFGIPVMAVRSWRHLDGVEQAETAEEAVERALERADAGGGSSGT
ncbi:MAG: TIGR00725 family protein [Candidatus Eisenbacteria bacterium]|nr:TIGR00725 family protein [Candidatus Eisenbacteria bacterium]